jgi:threonine aldolase
MAGRPADFRSDTVTLPTARMLEAMASAQVGDAVLGDDPTVAALERRFAELFGHEAALFMPSGTMSNQCAVAAHIEPGEEVIVESDSHIFQYEGGGLARVAGAHVRTIAGDAGMLPVEEVRAAIRHPSVHMPRTALICLEQTHLFSGGSILPMAYLESLRALSLRHGIPVHVDGARLFNALVETGAEPAAYGSLCDSLSVSLCKGLSCPVGSMLVGSGAFIERAKRVRKWLGGGMRQAGYLAACGLVALDEVVPRLSDDNARCRKLGGAILGLPGLQIAQPNIDTNILFVEISHPGLDGPMMEAALTDHGVLALAVGERMLRFVTHRMVTDPDVDRAAQALQEIVTATPLD